MDSQPVATDPTPPRRIRWRGIRLLFLVTTCLMLLGIAGAGIVQAITLEQGAALIVTKYADPADGTEFNFECEGEFCVEPSFVLSHTYSAVVVDSVDYVEGTELITVTERLSQAQIDAGWRIYRIECTDPPAFGAVAQVQNGVFGPEITIEDGITGTIVIPVAGYIYDPYECDVYNAIPSSIIVEKAEVPAVGTNYNFRMISVTVPTFEQPLYKDNIDLAQAGVASLAATSTFTLDDAVPDDNDGIVRTAIFSGLFPGSYSFLEVNDANLQGIACSVNSQPAQFDKALLDILLPIDSGPVEPFSQGFNSIATNCGGDIWSSEVDRGFAYEYDLDDAPSDFASVFFRFGLDADRLSLSTPLTVEVYGYAGDGLVDDADFGAGSLLGTVQVSGTESFELDVTDLISDLLGAPEQYAGFNFVVPPDQDYPEGTVLCTPYLLFRSAKGVEVPLGGAQVVHCVFTNTAPGGRIVVDKVLTGTVDGLGDQMFFFNLNGPVSGNFSLSADAAPYVSGLLAPGVYTLTESVPSNWSAPVYACSDGANAYPATAIAIVAGRTVTCTVTNQPLPIGISLVKTVRAFTGTPTCASAGSITVVPNTVVEFCYKVTNTGQYTLGLHTLDDSVLGNILNGVEFDLGPGASVDTVALGKVVTQTVTVSVTNIATWTAEIFLDAALSTAQLQTRATSVTAASVVVQEDPSSLEEIDQPVGDRRVFVPTLQR